jgi:hypothetical protein
MLSVFITPCTKPTRIQSRPPSARCARRPRENATRRVVARGAAQVREVARDREVDQALEQRDRRRARRHLEVAEAHERRRHAAHDRARLGARIAVVEHVAHHRLAGAHQDSARVVGTPRWCIASLHRNSRSEERSTARPSALREYGVGPGALELQLPALAARVDVSPSVIARPSPSCPAQLPNWWPP